MGTHELELSFSLPAGVWQSELLESPAQAFGGCGVSCDPLSDRDLDRMTLSEFVSAKNAGEGGGRRAAEGELERELRTERDRAIWGYARDGLDQGLGEPQAALEALELARAEANQEASAVGDRVALTALVGPEVLVERHAD